MRRTSRWNGWMAVGLASLGAVLFGCGGGPETNGKHGVLYLAYSKSLSAGLPFEVRVVEEREVQVGDPNGYDFRLDRWDFTDTRLEVEAPEGLAFGVRYAPPHSDGSERGGYVLSARCDATPDVPHEVRLRVRAHDGSLRYEDAFDVTCQEPDGMTVRLVVPPSWSTGIPMSERGFVGGAVTLALALTAQGRLLNSTGLVVHEPRGVLRQHEPQGDLGNVAFDMSAAGVPELRYRNVVQAVPLTVVEVADWTLALGPWQAMGTGDTYALTAAARDADGTALLGLQACTWQLRFGTDRHVTREGCSLMESGRPTRTCVTAYGRTTCREDP